MFVRGFNVKCGNSDVTLKDSTTVVQGKFTISALKVLELVSVARRVQFWECVYT